MIKKTSVLLVLLMFTLILFAKPVDEKTLSILSCENIWLSDTAINAGELDLQFYKTMIDEYIKLPDFDYGIIPPEDVKEFKQEALSLNSVNAKNLAQMFDNSVAKLIIQVLSDSEIQRARRDNYPEDSELLQLKIDKSVQFGFSEEFISQLINAEFIFLPYISNVKKTYSNSIYKHQLEGGILWYKIHISDEGIVRLVLRQSDTSKSTGRADARKTDVVSRFSQGEYVIDTTPEEYAMYDAIRKLIFEMERKMKTMPEFAQITQIAEKKNDIEFKVNMGLREGIHLDDGFHIVRYWEDNEGNLMTNRIGYARIVKTADNKSLENHDARSVAKAFYSQPQVDKIYLMENPRSGLEFSISVGPRIGMKIPQESTVLSSEESIIDKDVKNSTEIDLNFGYNLAPIIDFSQLYYDFEIGYGFPIVDYYSGSNNTSAYTLNFYTGLSKKIWFGRHAAVIAGKLGYDRISISATQSSSDNSISANSLGAKLGLNYIYMMSPNWQLFASVDYKVNTAPIYSKLQENGSNVSLDGNLKDAHSNIRIGGTQIKLGITYVLGFNPFNINGWIDSYKKY